MTNRERFINVMEYKKVDRVPNYEVGVWGQTIERWEKEGLDINNVHWDWFTGSKYFNIDLREYIPINFGMIPGFTEEVIEKNERYEVKRHKNGVVTKALLEETARGTRASMDQYLSFPVKDKHDFDALKKMYDPNIKTRYPAYWRECMLPGWKNRSHVLVLGRNCSTLGFFWRAREWMGIENLCYAWYDQPELMHEMMEFISEFTIEVFKPILEEIDSDYVFINSRWTVSCYYYA